MNDIRHKLKPFYCLIVVSMSYLLANFHRQSMAIMVPHLVESLGINNAQIGILGAIVFYIYGLTQIPYGYLCGKIGGVKVIQFSLIFLVIGSYVFGRADSYIELFIGRLLIGFAVSGFYVPGLNLIRQWFDIRVYSFYIGIFLAIGNIGSLLSTSPYEFLLSNYTIPEIYLAFTIFTVFLVFLSLFLYEEKMDIKLVKDQDEKENKEFIKFFVVLSIFGLMYYSSRQAFISLWGTSYFMTNFNYDLRIASFLMMVISIGGIVFTPLAGKIADKYGRFTALLYLSIATAGFWIIAAIIPKNTPFIIVVFIAFWIGALNISTIANAFTMISDYSTKKHASLFVGFLNATNFFGSAFFMQALGVVFENRKMTSGIFTIVLLSFALLILISLYATYLMKKRLDKSITNSDNL